MWKYTRVTERLGVEYPIIQAGMAGGSTTPQLVAAVSNVGGLGTLGAGYMTPEQLRAAIREIRTLTDRPFAVNLFVPEPVEDYRHKIETSHTLMQSYRNELGIDSIPVITKYAESFEDQIAVVLEEKVAVFSFTFGIPTPSLIRELQNNHTVIMGTATTVKEAMQLETSGVDMIVGQGSEAGGHRGTFMGTFEDALVGTMALIPQIVDHVRVPVIAAGGIMDGRGIAASLVLGAEAAQMGTAFLTCTESGAHQKYKEAILTSTEESTSITRAFSGKPARGIKNRFMTEMDRHDNTPGYPVQNALTRDIRLAASKQNRTEFMSLWAGQASRLSLSKSATELMNDWVTQITDIFEKQKKPTTLG